MSKTAKLDQKAANKLKKLDNVEPMFHFNLTDKGVIKSKSLHNIEEILEMDANFRGMFKYNEFTDEIDIVRDSNDLLIQKGQMKDGYIDEIASYIEDQKAYQHVLFDPQRIRSALTVVANRHQYNPIVDYMNEAGQKWDQKPRLMEFFPYWLGCPDDEITRLITKLWFTGAVAKAYHPTVKFDFVLDLVGGQGAGKTTILQRIAPLGYYTDQFSTFENKDDFSVMRRALIVNDDEMTATANSSFEVLKKFITLQEFEYRKPYGHSAERFPKGFVLARTTNDLYYLRDKTGERRFLPLLVDKQKQCANPVTQLTPELVQQVWGEAVCLYKAGDYNFDLSKSEEAELNDHRKNFMYTDTVEDMIADCLENEWKDRDFLVAKDIAFKISPGTDLARSRKLSNQIANIMINRFGWRKGIKKIDGKARRGYTLK